jgi:hypothetical protein
MAKQALYGSSDVRRAHRSAFVGQHPDDGIDDPPWTAIALPLALDRPWRRIAGPQPLELLGYVAQSGAVGRRQDFRNFCHKIARSATLVRWYLRRSHCFTDVGTKMGPWTASASPTSEQCHRTGYASPP